VVLAQQIGHPLQNQLLASKHFLIGFVMGQLFRYQLDLGAERTYRPEFRYVL
jgi:hypothetical protein